MTPSLVCLPTFFFGTGIPTIVMVLRQKRPHTDVLIVDASKNFLKVGKNNKLRASDIKRIVDAVLARADVEKFAQKVSRDDIRKNDYNLNIPRYVDSSDDAETWDMYACMFGGIPRSEVAALAAYWQAFPGLQEALFAQGTTPYTEVTVSDVRQLVTNHPAVQAFYASFAAAFAGFDAYLEQELIVNMTSVNIAQQETTLSAAMFARLESVPLINRYEAYQELDDAWTTTAVDLEMIQTEGFEAVRAVDPHMVLKKKDGKEEEVQDGWQGRIIPFELVQQSLLAAEYAALKDKENRLGEITAEYAEILDGLSEEDKESECINDNKDAFVAAKVTKEAKRIQAEIQQGTVCEEDSLESKLLQINALLAEEKALKTSIKKESTALHMKTKATIEGLSDQQAHALLEQKWIAPLVARLHQMPEQAVTRLIDKVKTLTEKYAVTYEQVEADIKETGASLAALLGDLTGSDYDMQALHELKKLLEGKAQNIKKAMLEKMFPKPGATEPEVRFQGFEGEWEENNLEKVAVFSKGYGYSKRDLCISGTPIILYGRLYTNFETVIEHVDTYADDKSNSVYSTGIEVIVPASGESAEDIARASVVKITGAILGGDLNIIKPTEEINSVFFGFIYI